MVRHCAIMSLLVKGAGRAQGTGARVIVRFMRGDCAVSILLLAKDEAWLIPRILGVSLSSTAKAGGLT